MAIIRDFDIDGAVEKVFDLNISVLWDGAEIGVIDQRYGVEVGNTEIREDLLRKVKEIVIAHYVEIERKEDRARLDAIVAAVEDWSKTLA